MQTKSDGLSLPMILTLIFLVLKLTNNINWSWWYIFSPLWVDFIIIFIISFIFVFAREIKRIKNNYEKKIN